MRLSFKITARCAVILDVLGCLVAIARKNRKIENFADVPCFGMIKIRKMKQTTS
jgi:hypothetical protein